MDPVNNRAGSLHAADVWQRKLLEEQRVVVYPVWGESLQHQGRRKGPACVSLTWVGLKHSR